MHTSGISDRDDGAILLMVLLFMIGVGIIIGSLLTATTTAEVATTAQNTAHAADYAVDGGIENGIDRLRNTADTAWCNTVHTEILSINGQSVTVTCNTLSGSITSISNWALVSLDPANYNGLQTSSGASTPIQILGPTYVEGGMYLQSKLEIDAKCAGNNIPPSSGCTAADGTGYIYQHENSCTGITSPTTDPANKGSKLPPIGNWSCTNLVPNVNPAAPTVVPSLPSVIPTTVGSCTTLYPGKYTAPGTSPTPTSYPLPSLQDIQNVYLVSGVYYFDNVGTIDLGGTAKATTLFGGQPSVGESQVISGTPCGTDPRGWQALNGTGVEIVLGGNSAINTDKGGMELYTRMAAAPGSLPQPSLITVPANPAPVGSLGQPTSWGAGWDPTTLNGGLVLQSATGTQPNVAIHGLVYTPDGSVSLFGTNNSVGEILGGVVAWDITLQKSASASNFEIATALSPTTSTDVLTATVQYGGKPIKATAGVTINADESATVTSWVVSNP